MKKSMLKKSLLSLCVAFAATAAVGVSTVFTADASTTIDEKFASYNLAGSSVRYAKDTEDTREGFSFVASMKAEDYAYVMNAENGYTDIKFGVLVGPEAYYTAHPFNDQTNINTYYSLNHKADGKAMIYDFPAYEFTAGTDENVYFRASVVDLEDENLIRDYRGVAYVEYTKDDVTEKYFFTGENGLRCPVEIADLAIDKMQEQNETAEEEVVTANNEKIAALTTKYIDTIEWDAITSDSDISLVWYQDWKLYVAGGAANAPAFDPFLKEEYRGNRYIESQYTTTYEYVKEGKESVPYVDWNGSAEDQRNVTNLEGVWTLKGTTVCEKLDAPVVIYSREITFNKFYRMPEVNGAMITGTADAYGSANSGWTGGYYYTGSQWNETNQNYKFVDGDGGWIIGYSQKATGNFIVDVELSANVRKDLRIYTATDKYIALRSEWGGANGVYVRSIAYAASGKLIGSPEIFTQPDNKAGNLKIRVVMYNNVLYVLGKLHTVNGQVVENDNYTLLFTLDQTNGILGRNGMNYSNDGGSAASHASRYAEVLNAATQNEFAFAFAAFGYSSASGYLSLIDDDTTVASFIEPFVASVTLNGTFMNIVESGWTTTDGVHSTSSAGLKVLGKGTGDYMVRLKLNSASNSLDFRIHNTKDNYFSLVSETKDAAYDHIFMDSLNGGWFRENRIGYNTAKFLNEDGSTATNSDGYLDIMIVRYQGVLYVYTCEYLEENQAKTFDSWQLFIQVADANSKAVEGITHKDANGTGISGIHSTLLGQMLPILASEDNLFVLRPRSGGPYSAKAIINDNDADVATFMASEKTLAAYPKA